jgi:hypothetical protein
MIVKYLVSANKSIVQLPADRLEVVTRLVVFEVGLNACLQLHLRLSPAIIRTTQV